MTSGNLYAGFWRQLWGGSLDIVIAMLSFSILFILVFAALVTISPEISNYPLDTLSPWFKFTSFLYYFLYRTVFIASPYRATYGMKAVNIFITDLEENRISFPRAVIRELLTYVSSCFLWLGYLIIPFTEKKQGFHDMLTKCLVLKKEPRVF